MISRQNSCDDMSHTVPSLRSSFGSLYKNYDFHLNVLKMTGIVVLLSIMSATLAITSNLHVCKNETDCIRLVTASKPFNNTLCSYLKRYPLPDDYFVTVCAYHGDVRIDVRKFIHDQPTALGYFLNTRQWMYLKRLVPHIDKYISEARTVNSRN